LRVPVPPSRSDKFGLAMTTSMNAEIGDVTDRNRPGPGFVPIAA
jgi:hypothetical protein